MKKPKLLAERNKLAGNSSVVGSKVEKMKQLRTLSLSPISLPLGYVKCPFTCGDCFSSFSHVLPIRWPPVEWSWTYSSVTCTTASTTQKINCSLNIDHTIGHLKNGSVFGVFWLCAGGGSQMKCQRWWLVARPLGTSTAGHSVISLQGLAFGPSEHLALLCLSLLIEKPTLIFFLCTGTLGQWGSARAALEKESTGCRWWSSFPFRLQGWLTLKSILENGPWNSQRRKGKHNNKSIKTDNQRSSKVAAKLENKVANSSSSHLHAKKVKKWGGLQRWVRTRQISSQSESEPDKATERQLKWSVANTIISVAILFAICIDCQIFADN